MPTMDLEKILDDLDRRATRLEQWISNPNAVVTSGSDATFDTITIGSGGGSVTLDSVTPGTPTGLSLSSGAFFDVIYVDSDWTLAVGDTQTVEYEIEISKKIAGVYQLAHIQRTIGSNFRYEPVEPNTTYGFRVRGVSRTGKFGAFTAWVDITTGQDATIPPVVTGLSAFRGATSVIVKFDPLTAVQAPDVANGEGLYEIQVDTANTFNTGNLRTMRSTASIVAFSDIFTEGTWYARVSAIDTSGNQGGWSAVVSTTAGGVVDSMVVAGLSAAKITVGVMNGDRIDVNTLNVNRLLDASTITSKTINIGAGGQFRIGNPTGGFGTSGILINDQGIRLYQDGFPVIVLDAITGTGAFTGAISGSAITGGTIDGGIITGALFRTASSGRRIELSNITFNAISFYSGVANETTPGKILTDAWPTDTSRPMLRLEAPRLSGGGAPQPHIDLIGGSGTIGRIEMAGSERITVSGGGYSYIFDGNGLHMGHRLALNENAINLRGWNDASHQIFWTNDQINYNTSIQHRFGAGGIVRFTVHSAGATVNSGHLFVGDFCRLGELYGNRGLYITGNHVARIDSATSSVALSIGGVDKIVAHANGYNYLKAETSMEQHSLFLKAANDYNHRIYYHASRDGVFVNGYASAGIISVLGNSQLLCGDAGWQRAAAVNAANSAYILMEASSYYSSSDPRLKKDISPLRNVRKGVAGKSRALDDVKGVTPIRFKWKNDKNPDVDQDDHFGFSADELPSEVTKTSMLSDNEPVKMVDSLGITALLWQAVRELTEEVEELKLQLTA